MPTWGEQLRELSQLKESAAQLPKHNGPSPVDALRRKYLMELHSHTGRAAIVYATCWLENKPVPDHGPLSLSLGDKQGFMEAVSNVTERQLDLFITSPGGSVEAAESIMNYLRTRFDHIRAVIPIAAMSAATMMALTCDEILMGTQSQLGPIDPQFTLATPEGPRSSPGQAILDQFELAKRECEDPKNIGAWLPILRSLTPGLIAQCHHSIEQGLRFVSEQLERHMFRGQPDRANQVAKWFSDFNSFKSHSRPITLSDVQNLGLNVTPLEEDQTLQDLVLSVHHSVRHTFNDTGTTKLIENHHGRAYIEMAQPVIFPQPEPAVKPNRQQRRKNQQKG